MKQLRRLLFVCLVTWSSFFLTGCDAGKFTEFIQKVVNGIEKALPAIQQVVDTVKNVTDGIGDVTNTNTADQTADQPANNNAGITIPTAGDRENIGGATGDAGAAIGSIQPLARPNGLAAIKRTFGEPGKVDLKTIQIPCGPNGQTRNVACHTKIAARLKAVFDEIKAKGLSKHIKTYDGCYNPRKKRGGSSWSVHAWGIAVDLNASENPMGQNFMTEGQKKLAEVFNKYGFYSLPGDPMHFQYCTGY